MPHERSRLLLPLLEKRLQLFPAVGVLGARQTGKSTLLRDLLPKLRTTQYVTLDRDEVRQRALTQPTLFIQSLESPTAKTVCIDEVQKAGVLFDTIKAEVDERKRPGRFALSGSTEFSKKTGVHESLTGRIALLHLFPLSLSEIAGEKPTLKDASQWLTRGGMPGIFAVREEANRSALFESWIETTCTRDLSRLAGPRFDPDLARRILESVARADANDLASIANDVGKTARQIRKYLDAMKAIFIVYEIPPHPTSVGKPHFHLFDAGIAHELGANLRRRLQTFFINEIYSAHSYKDGTRPHIFYYRTSRGSEIDFVIQTKAKSYALQLAEEEAPHAYVLRAATAFVAKNPTIHVVIAAPCLHTHKVGTKITIHPWPALPR